MAAVIGIAGYPAWNEDETQLLGFAIPLGTNFHVFDLNHQKIGEHWQLQDAVNLLASDEA